MSDAYTLFAANEDGERPSEYEAETVHDFIQDMMRDVEFWQQLPAPTQQAMLVSRDTLCWALAHDDNLAFASNIKMWAEAYRTFSGHESTYDN